MQVENCLHFSSTHTTSITITLLSNSHLKKYLLNELSFYMSTQQTEQIFSRPISFSFIRLYKL
jgi:hypothetical protein